MTRLTLLALLLIQIPTYADDPTRFYPEGQTPKDSRLTKLRTLRNDYFPMKVPASKKEWATRSQRLRERVLVGTGLWPLPKKTPLNPVIHGLIKSDGYTIEKVFFASYPGMYVTGNLYRPSAKKAKMPGILCPHGHWRNGRFYDVGEAGAKKIIKGGGEKWLDGARNPIQARCAQLARMGCVVFNYDMVGYADSTQIGHRAGFTDAEAALRLQNFMGLQTWNSVRALDFLLSLPDVDKDRIAVTGASGGGTQTFMLCAIDDRPDVAFPAVMVSTAMQGGCICENCSYLRIGAGNIDLAALTAPRPLGMTGARDWTIEIEKKGLPELKKLYAMLGVKDKVMAKCFPQFGHNYNQVSRAVMYKWMNKHLKLGLKSTEEKPFQFRTKADLTVFDADHPRPNDAVNAKQLRAYLTKESQRQIQGLKPTKSGDLDEYRKVIGTALRVMIGSEVPHPLSIEFVKTRKSEVQDGIIWTRSLIRRKGTTEEIPILWVRPEKTNRREVIIWVHPEGKSSLVSEGTIAPAALKALKSGASILALDVLGTGELKTDKPLSVDKNYAGYTFGYNPTMLAHRVHDILTAVAAAQSLNLPSTVGPRLQFHLVGFEKAGPWVMLARALCGKVVSRTVADAQSFSFSKVKSTRDEMMLPGALKYGGLGALASLSAPNEMLIQNPTKEHRQWLESTYQASGAKDRLKLASKSLSATEQIEWLLRLLNLHCS